MKDGVRIVLAVGVGYLLGRTRKLRLAMTLAGVGATGRLGKGPAGLVKEGTKVLGSSPEVKALTETVRGRLVDVGKAAAVTAAGSRIDALSDRIQERTRSMGRPPRPGAEEEEEHAGRGARRPQERYEEEGYEQEPRRERPERERPRATRRRREEEPAAEEEERPRRPAARPPVRRTRR